MITVNGKNMKTAIVHDWFCNMGGGDKLVESFLEIMPDSPIYTLCYLEKSLTDSLKKAEIIPSFLQKKLNQKKDNHQSFLPFMPVAIESFDMNEYDLVLSSSSCCAKGVVVNPNTVHICYCNTPMRYTWEFFYEYTENMSPLKKRLVKYLIHYLKIWDVISSNRVDYFIANSQNVARRIWRHYRREAVIIHPPIDTEYFVPGDENGDFFLCVSRLVKYKRIDLAVLAFNRLGLPLVVIGKGAEFENLKKIAGPCVKVIGRQPDNVVREYYQKCRAFVFPGEEDFGMAPLEAQACGRPVIAYGKGGALETVVEGRTGIFFDEQNVEALCDAVRKFEKLKFEKEECVDNARKFGKEIFLEKIRNFIISKAEKIQNKSITNGKDER